MVCGSSCSHSTVPIPGGAEVHEVATWPSDAGAEKSCGLPDTRLDAVDAPAVLRASWNSTLFPATAVVVMMSTRMPTTYSRFRNRRCPPCRQRAAT